jgi:hypothetical protein
MRAPFPTEISQRGFHSLRKVISARKLSGGHKCDSFRPGLPSAKSRLYDDCVRVVPGDVIVMTPPQAQLQVDPAVSAGTPPSVVRAAPGFHGVVTGTHGIGTSTPSAALVAAATVGFARLEHMPNGGMLTSGAQSLIVAAGRPSTVTLEMGNGDNAAGATPKLHCSRAPRAAFGGIGVTASSP